MIFFLWFNSLQELTGGTLLSRNKEYIVFYRGNDFLTPCIRDTLVEREKLATVQQDAEEEARSRASGLISSNSKAIKRAPCFAGTLTETLKAYNHWANQPSSEDRDEMRRDLALSQQESLIRNLERKLSFVRFPSSSRLIVGMNCSIVICLMEEIQ